MRPVVVSVSALGNSPWVPVNTYQLPFSVGLGYNITSGANLTSKVQHTFDSPGQTPRVVTITRAGTVATVNDTAHGLSVGDSIQVMNSGSSNLDGTYDVATVINANSYAYTVVNTGAAASVPITTLISFRVFDHATMTGMAAKADGNYAFNIAMTRLVCTAFTSGKGTLTVLQGAG